MGALFSKPDMPPPPPPPPPAANPPVYASSLVQGAVAQGRKRVADAIAGLGETRPDAMGAMKPLTSQKELMGI
jgi:hypothetical protein